MRKSIARCVALLVACSTCALMGCRLDKETPKIKNTMYVPAENTIHLCSDGLDNDGDTLVDCYDPECQASTCSDEDRKDTKSGGNASCQKCSDNLCMKDEAFLPGDTVCPWYTETDENKNTVFHLAETTNYTCSDGLDNDGDGYTDCRDRSCAKATVCCVKSTDDEATLEDCSDGLDNDCDGYTDCADRSCLAVCCTAIITNDEAKEVCNATAAGYDKDKCEEVCSDGVDSDCNGYIDCNDRNCSAAEVCTKSSTASDPIPEDSESTCSDSKDNDMDGYIDCGDSSCAQTEYCADVVIAEIVEPGARPHDFDSWVEVAKLDRYCQERELCTNGVDDDRNGMTDCQEYQCHMLSLKWDDYRKAQPEGSLICYAFTCTGAAMVPCAVDPCANQQ